MIWKKIHYWNRIFKAYVLGNTSQLSFWHGEPELESNINIESIGAYYMSFDKKANYEGHLDSKGIPMLDYQGQIGIKYNPIAISQWGLGNYNLWKRKGSEDSFLKFIKSAEWLVDNMRENQFKYKVWMHDFDFEYRDTLKSPWYSGLAQGQAISLLVRAYKETNNKKYCDSLHEAFKVFFVSTREGGVNHKDKKNQDWIEEYIVEPPTHILNGFIWGLWGVYDYALLFKDNKALSLFHKYKETLINELSSYDTGYWSLYEHSGTKVPMIASPFYHKLHIVQLKIMYEITSLEYFNEIATKWSVYQNKLLNKNVAILQKIIFKVFYY